MSKNNEVKKPTFKPGDGAQKYAELAKLMESPYFKDKDRKAKDFLKNHPIPEEFRKKK